MATLWTPVAADTILLFDPTDTDTITDDGGDPDLVSQIDDLGPNEDHLTQGTGSLQPTTNSRTFNSLNVIDSDGSNYLLCAPAFPANGNVMAMTVCQVDTVDSNKDSIIACNGTVNFQIDASSASQWDIRIKVNGTGGGDVKSNTGPFTGIHTIAAEFNFDDQKVRLWIDGTCYNENDYTIKLSTSQQFVALVDNGATKGLDGAVGAIVVINDVTTLTRQRYEGFYADQFATQAQLSDSHPYKSAPPTEYQVGTVSSIVQDVVSDIITNTNTEVVTE